MRFLVSFLLFFTCFERAYTAPRFAACFADNAVLQQGESTAIWGFEADPNQSLIVKLGDLETKAKVKPDGSWHASFSKLKASAEERQLSLIEADKTVTAIAEVVVGEVWLAAGQSNMQMKVSSMVKGMPAASDWVESANLPQIRFRRINDPVLTKRESEAIDLAQNEAWIKMTPKNVGEFSAAAAVFAREISSEVDCPVGILEASWGGKPIEPFIPREAFESPLLSKIKQLSDTEQLEELKSLKGGVIIRNPEGYPGAIFNARLAPLTQMNIAGFIWYQAESNSGKGEDPREYRTKMEAMASGWRSRWQQNSLPLYFVQLPSYPTATGWIRAREEQRLAQSIPNSAMAVTIDILGEGIHPPDKIELGKRLAKCALEKSYHIPGIQSSGPKYEKHVVKGNRVTVYFTHTNGGLSSGNRALFSDVELNEDPEVKWFELAGEDGVWHTASALIQGDTVWVSSPMERAPVAVRYACHTNPQSANLYNKSGLPASPFCSDLKMLGWQDHQ